MATTKIWPRDIFNCTLARENGTEISATQANTLKGCKKLLEEWVKRREVELIEKYMKLYIEHTNYLIECAKGLLFQS